MYHCNAMKTRFLIHRLVCELFHPNPENKPTVDHINRDRSDNRASNLRWATWHEQLMNRDLPKTKLGIGVKRRDDPKAYLREYYKIKKAMKNSTI